MIAPAVFAGKMAKSRGNLRIRKESVTGGLGLRRLSKKAFIFACVYGPCAAGGPADCQKISKLRFPSASLQAMRRRKKRRCWR